MIKGQRTMAELADAYKVHPNHVTQWKRQLLESLPEVFGRRRQEDLQQQEELTAQLYQQIGQLKVEWDWLKKSLDWTVEYKRMLIERDHCEIPIARQCALLGLHLSILYYHPDRDDAYNEQLMRLLAEQYTRTPFNGVPRMTDFLHK